MIQYSQGQLTRLTSTFRDASGALVDPTNVYFSYQPIVVGTVTTLHYGVDAAVVKSSTGVYYVDLDTTTSGGEWLWRWWATGTGAASTEGSFYVRPNLAAISPTPGTTYVRSIIAGTGISVSGFPDVTVSIPQAIATTSNVNFGSLTIDVDPNDSVASTTGFIKFLNGPKLFPGGNTVLHLMSTGNEKPSALHAFATSGTAIHWGSTSGNTVSEFVIHFESIATQALNTYGQWSFSTGVQPDNSQISGILGEFAGTLHPTSFDFTTDYLGGEHFCYMRLAGDETGQTGNILFGFSNSGTPRSVIQLWTDDPTNGNKNDSNSILFIGKGNNGSIHGADWKLDNHVTSTAGASTFRLQSVLDAGPFTDRLTITDAGILSISGTSLVFQSGGVTGTIAWTPATSNKTITLPNGTTDFTSTGGTSQVVKQTSSGGAFTVARLAGADLSDYATAFVNSITGTSNQVIASASVGAVTLSLPQSIATSSTPQFAKIGLGTPADAAALLYVLSTGTANTAGDPYDVGAFVGTTHTPASAQANLLIQSNDALAADAGGTLGFGARYHTAATSAATLAAIGGYKTNNTSDNLDGYMTIAVRSNSSMAERVRIVSSGNVLLQTGVLDTKTGGSTTISSGTGTVKMSSTNSANSAVWIPMAYNGTTYYVPGWTTNSP